MTPGFTRRDFLQISASAAGLLVGFAAIPASAGAGSGGERLNPWIWIGADDTIVVRVARTEMGQGIYTLTGNLIAEELEVDPSKLKLEAAPVSSDYINPEFGDMVTGNSQSAITSFDPLRIAGASARMLLVAAAARQWRTGVDNCEASNGKVTNRVTGAVLSYGTLAAAAEGLPPPQDAKLKDPAEWRLLGKPMRRLEGPEKVRGTALFGIDVAVPDMLIGTVVNCPIAGGRVRGVESTAAMRIPGVEKVVQLDDAVIVVANSFWAASQGISALEVDWDEGPNATLNSAEISASLDRGLANEGILVTEHGAAPENVHTRLALRFEAPLLVHAALEPPTATVAIGDDGVDVWAPTQVQSDARDRVAADLNVAPEKVRIHTTLAGGSFGRGLQVDFIRQAALAAREAGRPVKLIWSRSEEIQHGFYRPPAATTIDIGLDADGMPMSWEQRLAIPDIRPYLGMFDAEYREKYSAQTVDDFAVEGATPPYAFSRHRLTWRDVPLPLPLGWWRSVGHSFNAWFVEHALDVAAAKGGHDPVSLRLALLKDHPRHRAVLEAVTKLWSAPPAEGRFRGTALHESFGSIVGQSVEISISDGRLQAHRVMCAIDCGFALNPDGVRAQMEGGIIFGLTAALHGEITVQNGRVQQQNFDSYRLLTLRETPEIEVVIVKSDAELGGVGEPGVPPIAPALCNAVLAATGKPVTRLPIRLTT